MHSSKHIGYYIESDIDRRLIYLQLAGSLLSYVAIVYNFIIILVLSRPAVRSPTSILMQGLAIADLLTGLCSYGLEPLFQTNYLSVVNLRESATLTLPYPLCGLYVHIGQLVDMFHFVSVLLTTCLGIQKVLALKFPYWMRNNFKTKFAITCCVVCYTISFAIDTPRHFSVTFRNQQNVSFGGFSNGTFQTKILAEGCSQARKSRGAFLYATQYYPLVTAILLVVLSAIMCFSVVYIIHRLCHKNFRKKNIVQRTRERRSVMLITAILIIFLISEIPRLSIYVYLFFGPYLDNMLDLESIDDGLAWIVTDYRATLAINLKVDNDFSFTQLLLIVESLKIICLIGCMSNFFIYFTMSRQLRDELKGCLPLRSRTRQQSSKGLSCTCLETAQRSERCETAEFTVKSETIRLIADSFI